MKSFASNLLKRLGLGSNPMIQKARNKVDDRFFYCDEKLKLHTQGGIGC